MTIRRASRDFQVRPPRGPNFDPASMSVKVSGSMTIKDVVSRLGRLESMRQAAAELSQSKLVSKAAILYEDLAGDYFSVNENFHGIEAALNAHLCYLGLSDKDRALQIVGRIAGYAIRDDNTIDLNILKIGLKGTAIAVSEVASGLQHIRAIKQNAGANYLAGELGKAAALFEEAAQAYSNLGERLHTIWCLAQKIECVPAHQIATVTAQIDSAAQGN